MNKNKKELMMLSLGVFTILFMMTMFVIGSYLLNRGLIEPFTPEQLTNAFFTLGLWMLTGALVWIGSATYESYKKVKYSGGYVE